MKSNHLHGVFKLQFIELQCFTTSHNRSINGNIDSELKVEFSYNWLYQNVNTTQRLQLDVLD